MFQSTRGIASWQSSERRFRDTIIVKQKNKIVKEKK
nr:MAG TPA: hypothetical protein [Caudoviricetes sp.]